MWPLRVAGVVVFCSARIFLAMLGIAGNRPGRPADDGRRTKSLPRAAQQTDAVQAGRTRGVPGDHARGLPKGGRAIQAAGQGPDE